MKIRFWKVALIILIIVLVGGAVCFVMQNTGSGDLQKLLSTSPAAIRADKTSGEAPLTVTLTPRFMGLGDFRVEFGDGQINRDLLCAKGAGPDRDGCGSDDMKSIVHTYAKPGTYQVRYVVSRAYVPDAADVVLGELTVTVR